MSDLTVYVAGPLFTSGERHYLEQVAGAIERAGARTYLPHRDGGLASSGRPEADQLYAADLDALRRCDAIVAVLNGPDVDSGTAFELGYGAARGLPLIGIYDDLRIGNPQADLNVMISCSCSVVRTLDALHEQIQGLLNAD